ncbi:MAG TPA: NHL repeat-containing protein, partial [Acidimicrobiia bacterium]|nr:NHL repeat-containing protein [Acidimicrobiia bacterium]
MLQVRRCGLVGVLVLVAAVVLGGTAFAAAGDISTIAGTGTFGFSGDGAAAVGAQLYYPSGVAVDGDGNVFIADTSNHRVRRIDAVTGLISTFAGTGVGGFSGDGAAATSAKLYNPTGVAVDGGGNVFIADFFNHRVRRVDAGTGLISTIAGIGTAGFSGDGAAATDAKLNSPYGVAVDGAGNVFIADTSNHRVRRVDVGTGLISTIAGTGTFGFSGDGAAATSAKLNSPFGVAVDGVGNVFIADSSNHRVRRVDVGTGLISTFAGTGTFGFSGDGAAATSAQLYYPYGVGVDGAGNVYIADSSNRRVRRVDVGTGFIDTFAGTGTAGFSGDGAAATSAQLSGPSGVAVDGAGNVFIADRYNQRIRKIDADPATVGLVDPSAGLWYLRSGSGVVSSFYFGNPGDYPMVGDWDCDGDDTPGMYRQSDGYVYLRNSNTQGVANIRFFFGNPGDVPIAGDFDDDGCDTVSIYRPSQGRFFIINALGENDGGLGAAEFAYYFGNPGDKPFVGDFNGDGTETVGLHRESTGLVYFRNTHT